MITNTKEMLNNALKNHYAIPHFNINNLEWTRFILEKCNELNNPVILGVSESTVEYMGGYDTICHLVKDLVKNLNIQIPVVIHLDHGSSIESCIKAIDAGFTSVMIDASKYDFKTNKNITKQVVDYAHSKNVTVEAEIGYIGKEDSKDNLINYAKLEDAILLCETGIDSLAPAVGNVHGLYNSKPNLDFNRIANISKETNIPLVLHGGTGISNESLIKAINNGIAKININTELQIVWTSAIKEYINKNPYEYDPRKIIKSGEIAIKEAINDKLHILNNR